MVLSFLGVCGLENKLIKALVDETKNPFQKLEGICIQSLYSMLQLNVA